jgi:hypothetical protein
MIIINRPELSPEEKHLPLAKYYNLPLHSPGPLEQQIIDLACPIEPKLAIKAENFLDLVQPEGYQPVEYGYCMMPDGTGYQAVYTTYPNCTPQMLKWYLRWFNIPSKSQPKDKGIMKYKIWNPADHIDHGFVGNGKSKWDGMFAIETLDLGAGEEPHYAVRHALNLRDYGLSEERENELNAAGVWVDCAYESFHTVIPPHTELPGRHLALTLSRTSPRGIMEKCTREWIGWGAKDGKIMRDFDTPSHMLCEAYLKKVLIHATVEAQQLAKFLPELYAHYKDLPDDED